MSGDDVDGVMTTLVLSDGHIEMHAHDVPAIVRVSTPRHTQLSLGETHARVTVDSQDTQAVLGLDAEILDALAVLAPQLCGVV